jgi:iron complex transport system substrate-binding protein
MRPLGLRRERAVVPAILLSLLLVAGCAAAGGTPTPTLSPATPPPTIAPTPTPAAFPTTVTDDEGTVVSIQAEPAKIVSLTPAATEILYGIGAGPRVVAKVEDVANFPPEAASVPVVATFKGVDVEKIVSLGADLVVSGGADFGQGPAVEQLRRANIPVLIVGPTTTSGVLTDIRFLGQATGESASANTVADTMAGEFDTIRTATAGVAHPKVFYEIDASGAIYTAQKGSFLEELLSIAGADPITTGSASASDIALEKLVTANPDLILLGDAAYGVTADQVKARPGWGTIGAVKSGAILPVDDIVITRPGPRLVEGLVALVQAIHPELVLPSSIPTLPPAPSPAPS